MKINTKTISRRIDDETASGLSGGPRTQVILYQGQYCVVWNMDPDTRLNKWAILSRWNTEAKAKLAGSEWSGQ